MKLQDVLVQETNDSLTKTASGLAGYYNEVYAPARDAFIEKNANAPYFDEAGLVKFAFMMKEIQGEDTIGMDKVAFLSSLMGFAGAALPFVNKIGGFLRGVKGNPFGGMLGKVGGWLGKAGNLLGDVSSGNWGNALSRIGGWLGTGKGVQAAPAAPAAKESITSGIKGGGGSLSAPAAKITNVKDLNRNLSGINAPSQAATPANTPSFNKPMESIGAR